MRKHDASSNGQKIYVSEIQNLKKKKKKSNSQTSNFRNNVGVL